MSSLKLLFTGLSVVCFVRSSEIALKKFKILLLCMHGATGSYIKLKKRDLA